MDRRRRARRIVVLIAALCGMAVRPASGSGSSVPPRVPGPELMVYAAASLEDVLDEMRPAWQEAIGAALVIQPAASNTLARQILAAGRADVFLSADAAWMDRVEAAGLVDAASRRTFLSNQLVVVAPPGSALRVTSAADLAGPSVRRVSLADPESVPAGRYARQWLERSGVWDRVRDRVVPAVDAPAAVAAVVSGGVDAGVVYRTDAVSSGRARILFSVPETEAPRIGYVAAALKGPRTGLARRAVEWLESETARAVFLRRGFLLPDAGRPPAP